MNTGKMEIRKDCNSRLDKKKAERKKERGCLFGKEKKKILAT